MDPGSLLATTHSAGGLKVKLRLARPSDGLGVRKLLERERPCLAESAAQFTFYEPRERLVLAATAPVDGIEKIVGLADVASGPALVLAEDPEIADLLGAAGTALAQRVRRAA